MSRDFNFKNWNFKDILKQKAIVNNHDESSRALHQIERMKADGTLDWYYVQLRQLLSDAMNDKQLSLKLLKEAMLESIYYQDGKYVLHLKKKDQYATVFGSIVLDKKVPSEMIQINHLYEMAQLEEPLPRKRTEALKPYFEISKQANADTFFPRNMIRGYVDDEGQLCISSNIATWDESLIADALKQLKEVENIDSHYDGNDIIFDGIE